MLLDRDDTIIPDEAETELAVELSRALSLRKNGPLRVRLDDGTELALPRSASRLLEHLLAEMSRGNAVTLIPVHAELTTQEAADFLNVSRPYLIKLLESGDVPYHKIGTHRRVRFADLEAYRRQIESRRNRAMDDLADQAQDLELGY
ncbi:hypothetical protein N177_3919 [Lutibaculum baratangense AMV1]|uniref:Helix-turn-helix domain-containing protein n=1 Tax=Lutibaculum baratangense AMV1 TaxID=631454 RepID=V4QSM8_9HYPH|nr:hypothetical protein N177_3919 [Lutibaculum baratangense AMV1]